ncbi:hypothetical protein K458DRAFT_389894 [Lentithecium fluviatile CBS 122367]|uniref:Uncharacterized protein n=1 Tax=Lentithecium fluviatile CBS 122367 TaxID=1168545 RepID=A0A6G1IYT6_9PLEO|nr:hypothetical protein K458DRAFT_389894 [Lentithecium fluviatile CBS 122367]
MWHIGIERPEYTTDIESERETNQKKHQSTEPSGTWAQCAHPKSNSSSPGLRPPEYFRKEGVQHPSIGPSTYLHPELSHTSTAEDYTSFEPPSYRSWLGPWEGKCYFAAKKFVAMKGDCAVLQSDDHSKCYEVPSSSRPACTLPTSTNRTLCFMNALRWCLRPMPCRTHALPTFNMGMSESSRARLCTTSPSDTGKVLAPSAGVVL